MNVDCKNGTRLADVMFFGSMMSFVALGFWLIFAAYQNEKHILDEKDAFKAKCIDAGGYPASPWTYVKGHGEGYLCINPSAIIGVE